MTTEHTFTLAGHCRISFIFEDFCSRAVYAVVKSVFLTIDSLTKNVKET